MPAWAAGRLRRQRAQGARDGSGCLAFAVERPTNCQCFSFAQADIRVRTVTPRAAVLVRVRAHTTVALNVKGPMALVL